MSKITLALVKAALELADNERSKITEREKDIFGLTSVKVRALLNNLCSKDNTNYLEIGVYKGATLLSALAGNKKTKAFGIDNFSYDDREPKKKAPEGQIWENMKSHLYSNIDRFKDPDSSVNTDNITILEEDFKTVDWSKLPKFDLCFFDISPVTDADYDVFFEKVLAAMLPQSVVVFTNYSNDLHANQLNAALLKHEDKVDIQWKEQRISSGLSDATHYYSGICIVGLKKKAIGVKNA